MQGAVDREVAPDAAAEAATPFHSRYRFIGVMMSLLASETSL